MSLPPYLLTAFLGTVGISFIIGLELHAYRRRGETPIDPQMLGFGTTRTITLISALGFALWIIAPMVPFCVGLGVLGLSLLLDYRKHIKHGDSSLLPSIIGLLTYTLGPLFLTAPLAMVAALVVIMLLALGEQVNIRRFSDAFPTEEGVTLAKFMVLIGLIYPLLPDTDVPYIPGITWREVWLAVLVISGISYLGYLAHRYMFPRASTLLTGVLGGLYSSTATTIVLAQALKQSPESGAFSAASVIIATAMMYLRLLILIILLGHIRVAINLAPPFAGFITLSLLVAGVLAWRGRARPAPSSQASISTNPLDLPVAFLFAFLFVFFAGLTHLITTRFGVTGLHVLSFVVGFSDIAPFVLSLLAGKFAVSLGVLSSAVLIASASNNLLKAAYAIAFSRSRQMISAASWLILLAIASFIIALWSS